MRKFSLSLAARKKGVTEGVDGYDWNEAQPKWPITRIMNTAFGIISVIVWALILFRIFSSSGSEFEKMVLLNDAAREHYPETRQVLRINSQTDKDTGGEVIVSYPVYLEKARNLQLTARVNRRTFPPGAGEGYTFVIRESGDGASRYFPLSYAKSEKKLWYTFYRLCFEGVELDREKIYTLLVYCGEVSPEGGEYPVSEADFRFTVLDRDTYCNTVTCKRDVFKFHEE